MSSTSRYYALSPAWDNGTIHHLAGPAARTSTARAPAAHIAAWPSPPVRPGGDRWPGVSRLGGFLRKDQPQERPHRHEQDQNGEGEVKRLLEVGNQAEPD